MDIESEGDAEMAQQGAAPQPVAEADGLRVGDTVRIDPGRAWDASDLWKIDGLYTRGDGAPYASLKLAGRAGGLPLGETRTAIRTSWLRKVVAEPLPSESADYERGACDALRQVLAALGEGASPSWVVADVATRMGVEL